MIDISKLAPDTLGFNALVLGAPGSGKTTSLVTLAKAGLEVFVAFTEQGVNNLRKGMRVHDLTPEEQARIHYTYISPARGSFAKRAKGARDINRAAKFGDMVSGSRKDHDQFVQLLEVCADFIDQNGESFGAVDTWGPDRVFAIDGMSGLNDMCMALVIGDKPCASQQDWGIAMNQEGGFIKECANSECNFVLLGHLEQEKDEVSGRMIVTASALGRKLGPTIGKDFQDVILAEQSTKGYIWSTEDARIQLKYSNLPQGTRLTPSFVPLVEHWLEENQA